MYASTRYKIIENHQHSCSLDAQDNPNLQIVEGGPVLGSRVARMGHGGGGTCTSCDDIGTISFGAIKYPYRYNYNLHILIFTPVHIL